MTAPVIGYANLSARLVDAVPEFGPLLAEHLADNDGEVLNHLLFWDLGQYALEAHRRGDAALSARILAFLERALLEGDEPVTNVVLVSFVESFAATTPDAARFVSTWPEALRRHATPLPTR